MAILDRQIPTSPSDDRRAELLAAVSEDRQPATSGWAVRRIIAAGLLAELLLVLSFIPAPLIPLTADSGMDDLLPWLEHLGQPFHERLALLGPWVSLTGLAVGLEVALLLCLFLPYIGVLRLLRRCVAEPQVGRTVLVFGVLFQLTALCSRRLFSKDVFSYVLNGRIMAVHGGNPYLDVPARFPQDPFLPLVDWREVPSFYGPLWSLVSALFAAAGGEQLGVTLLMFRVLAAGAAVAAGVMIWCLLRRSHPEYAAIGTALWAWNPLVIFESGVNGHNDVLLGALLVAAVAGLARRRAIVGLVALAAAVLVKYSAAVLVPLYLIVLARRAGGPRERRRIALGAGVAALLGMACFLPFVNGGRTLAVGALVSSPTRYLNSPAELVYAGARLWLGDDSLLVIERMEFRPWWATARSTTVLFLEKGAIPIGQVEGGQTVLAINRSDGRWQRIYNPYTRETGYVAMAPLLSALRPSSLPNDPELEVYERGPFGGAVANRVNLMIRGFGWLVVLTAVVLLLRSAATTDDLIRGWLVLLTLVYWFLATWFFPWYLLWALAVAALRPRGPLVWPLVAWSAGVLLYYGAVPFEADPSLGWLYRWRVAPMFLPPLAVLVWYALGWRGGLGQARPARTRETPVGA